MTPRLTHLNFKYINNLVTGEMVRGMSLLKFDSNTLCAACEHGKQRKKPHWRWHQSVSRFNFWTWTYVHPLLLRSSLKGRTFLPLSMTIQDLLGFSFYVANPRLFNKSSILSKLLKSETSCKFAEVKRNNGAEFTNALLTNFLLRKELTVISILLILPNKMLSSNEET